MYQFYVLWYKYYKCCSLYTAQEMKFSIKDFFSKCAQIRKKLRVWSHLLRKSLMENFIFCAVLGELWYGITVQKMKFSIKDFFNKCDQRCLKRWSHLLKTLFSVQWIIFLLLFNPASHYVNLKEKWKIMKILIADVWYANNQLFCDLYTGHVLHFNYLFIWLSCIFFFFFWFY